MANKRWFDDWELSLTAYDDGMARIDVQLPHHDTNHLSIWTTKDLMKPLANFIDKMLCELTGTKVTEVITDGSNPPPTT
jgi:hypothetical protein